MRIMLLIRNYTDRCRKHWFFSQVHIRDHDIICLDLAEGKLTALKVITVFLMLIGVYLLTTQGQVLVPLAGDIFLIAACFCWSLGSVLVRMPINYHQHTLPLQVSHETRFAYLWRG